MTRSRAYRKNDQARLEQMNGGIVPKAGRLTRDSSVQRRRKRSFASMTRCVFTAVCSALFKLREKTRIGARVIKRYRPQEPSVARVLAHPAWPKRTRNAYELYWKLWIR